MRMTRFAVAMAALCALLWFGAAAAPGVEAGAGAGTSSASGAPTVAAGAETATTAGWWQNRSAGKWWALPLGLALAAAMGGILGTSVRMVSTRMRKPPAQDVRSSAPDTWPRASNMRRPPQDMRLPGPRTPGASAASSLPEAQVPFGEHPPDVPESSQPVSGEKTPGERVPSSGERALRPPLWDAELPASLPTVSMPPVTRSEWAARAIGAAPRLLHGAERDDASRLDAAIRRIGGADAMSITYQEAAQRGGPTTGLRLLLDTSMDFALVGALRSQGIDAVHLLDIDATPGAFAAASNDGRVLLTSDVGYIDDLIIGGETHPSVMLAGDPEATVDEYASAITAGAPAVTQDLENGALVVLGDDRIRVRDLPLRWCRPATPRARSGDAAARPDAAGPGETVEPLPESAYGRDPGGP